MKKNIALSLSLISLLSVCLSAHAVDLKSSLKAGANASLNNIKTQTATTTNTANTAQINSYRNQINAIVKRSNDLSSKFNSSVNGAAGLLMSSKDIAKARGNAAANSAQAVNKLAEYMVTTQSADIQKKAKSLSADQKAKLANYVKGMKDSMTGYTAVVKDATNVTAQVAKTPSVAVALSPEIKSLKQASANASNQAKLAGRLVSVLSK